MNPTEPLFAGDDESRAVTVTSNRPSAVGVPDTVPVEAPMVTPGGSPVADHVYGLVPPDAVRVNGVIAVPRVPVLSPGSPTVRSPGLAVHVGSPDCAGTSTASHAALIVLNSVQPEKRFFAAVSVQVRYRR